MENVAFKTVCWKNNSSCSPIHANQERNLNAINTVLLIHDGTHDTLSWKETIESPLVVTYHNIVKSACSHHNANMDKMFI